MSGPFQPPVNIDIPKDAATGGIPTAATAPLVEDDDSYSSSPVVASTNDSNDSAARGVPVVGAVGGWGANQAPTAGPVFGPANDSSAPADGDDALYGAATVVSASSSPAPLVADVAKRYVNSVVSNIAVNMPAFDGTTNALRMCPGAKVETQPDLKAPEGTDEFSMAWFGIARAIFTTVIGQESAEKAALRADVGHDGAGPLTLSVKEARATFASGLISIIPEVIGGVGSPGGLARRYAANRFPYTAEVEAVSRRMMDEWLAHEQLPASLQGKYDALVGTACSAPAPAPAPAPATAEEESGSGDAVMDTKATATRASEVAVQSLADLEAILAADADMWVTTFFPLYQQLKRSGMGKMRPVWADEATLRDLNKEEFAFQIYMLCTLRCLLKNKAGHARGVAIPKSWLQRLLGWIVAVRNAEAENDGTGAAAASTSAEPSSTNEEGGSTAGAPTEADAFTQLLLSCPGPIDTFHCIHVAPGHPAKHWLLAEDQAEVDVVPERLFDYLCLLFGSGPRYLTYGTFSLQSSFEAFLRPRPLMVEVTFVWEKHANEVRTEESATVYVEEAVRRSDLGEVFRLALRLVQEESGFMPEDKLALFSAAVCGPNGLVVSVKDVNTEMLRPPIAVTEDARDVTVSDIIARATQVLKERNGTAGEASSASLRDRKKEELSIELRLFSHELIRRSKGTANEQGTSGQSELANRFVVTPSTASRSGVCGLTNIGNTCYMNSALQCISALRPFRESLLAFPVSKYPTATITSAYVRLLSDMWSGQYDYASTRDLKDAIGEKERRFAGYQQQDANEFIEVMLDRMEEEVNEVSGRSYRERLDSDKAMPLTELSQIFWDNFLENNTGFIPKDFFHQSKTVFRCLTCGETSTVFDNNLTLSLNIKEPRVKKAMRVIALVNRPASLGTARNEEEAGRGVNHVSPEKDTIHVHVNLRVPADADGVVSAADLKDALRQNLLKNQDLRTLILATKSRELDEVDSEPTTPTPASPEGADVELDFAVGLLEVPEHGTTYAFANCILKNTSTTHNTAPPRVPMTDEEVDVAKEGTKPEYRVWYYLKDGHYGAPTAFGSLAYVEDLPLVGSPSGQSSPHLLPRQDPIDGEVTSPEEPVTGVAEATPSNVLSRHIISRGKLLASELLTPVSDDAAADSSQAAGAMPYATDYMMAPTAPSKPAAPTNTPKRLLLKVMYRKNRLTPLLDVTQSSNQHGDAWLHECRQAIREEADAEDFFGSQSDEEETGSKKAVKSKKLAAQPVTNVVVFLQYDGDEFDKVEIPTVGDSHAPRFGGWGGGFGGKHGENEDEQTCTLHECLTRAMETDKLTGDDSWYCPNCKEFRETCVQRSLFRLPPCLVMSFKRFKMVNSYHADKNNTAVAFPTKIDLSPYLDPEARAAPEINPHTQYKLRGVVYHSGSLSFGHYTASVYNDTLEKWVYCNDTNASVEQSAAPSANGAYILCYEQVTPSTTQQKPRLDL